MGRTGPLQFRLPLARLPRALTPERSNTWLPVFPGPCIRWRWIIIAGWAVVGYVAAHKTRRWQVGHVASTRS